MKILSSSSLFLRNIPLTYDDISCLFRRLPPVCKTFWRNWRLWRCRCIRWLSVTSLLRPAACHYVLPTVRLFVKFWNRPRRLAGERRRRNCYSCRGSKMWSTTNCIKMP